MKKGEIKMLSKMLDDATAKYKNKEIDVFGYTNIINFLTAYIKDNFGISYIDFIIHYYNV